MIYLKMEGHNFQYEMFDIIRLFYRDEEIVKCEDICPEDQTALFLMSRITKVQGKPVFQIQLKANAIHYVANIPIPANLNEKSEYKARKTLKREIKRQVYLALSKYSRRDMPWGILTGIRPAKIVHEMQGKGLRQDEILVWLMKYYMLSEKKANMLCEIANTERKILRSTESNMVSLYAGIPFCPSRCLYCSFTSNPIDKYRNLTDSYMRALKVEMDGVGDIVKRKGYKIQSLYIGGGTPTSISAEALKEMLYAFEDNFDLSDVREFTLEAGRPDSIDVEKLEVIKNSRVNRISINPQTMNDETLRLIGRSHTSDDIVRAFRIARDLGFDNINMDIIVGLPGETPEMFENTLKQIEELGPESLTVHTMTVKRASRFKENRQKFKLASDEQASEMINLANTYARKMGLAPYYLYRQKNILGNLENTGFCKPGLEGIYNIQMMEEEQTILALGAGGVTKVVYPEEDRLERVFNVKSVEEYIERIGEMVGRKKQLLL